MESKIIEQLNAWKTRSKIYLQKELVGQFHDGQYRHYCDGVGGSTFEFHSNGQYALHDTQSVFGIWTLEGNILILNSQETTYWGKWKHHEYRHCEKYHIQMETKTFQQTGPNGKFGPKFTNLVLKMKLIDIDGNNTFPHEMYFHRTLKEKSLDEIVKCLNIQIKM